MASGVVIQKAIIEVKFDDLNKAQLALKSAGVEMVKFGDQANKAKNGPAGMTKNIGDLSEMLDKKLSDGLARAFKATDRIQSIMGQAGAVVAIAGAAFGALALGAKALWTALDQGESAIDRAEQGLFDIAEAANIAQEANAQAQAAISAGWILTAESALKFAKVRTEIAARSAQNQIFFERMAQAESKVSFLSWTKTAAIQSATAKTFQADFAKAFDLQSQKLSELQDTMTSMGKAEPLPFEEGFKSLTFTITDALARMNSGADTVSKKATKAAKTSASAFVKAWEDAQFAVTFQLGIIGAEFDALQHHPLFQEENGFDRLKASVVALGVAIEDDLPLLADVTKAMSGAEAASIDWAKAQDGAETQLQATGQAATTAALGAAIYGESVKDAVNDVLESIAIEALSRGLFEGAMGLGALAIGRADSAVLHFASAAQFGAVGAAAAVGVAATGGFNGSSAEDSESASEGDAFTGAGDTGQDRQQGGSAQETTINVNLTAGSRPLLRIEQAQMAQELRGIMGA